WSTTVVTSIRRSSPAPASSSRRGYVAMSTAARAVGRASTSRTSSSPAWPERAKPPLACARSDLHDHPQTRCGSPALPYGLRLDRPGDEPHPGLVDDRQHVLGGDGGALPGRRPRSPRLAVAPVECRRLGFAAEVVDRVGQAEQLARRP